MRINVEQLLRESIGAQVDVAFDLGAQCLSDDIDVFSIKGTVYLLRTTEGIWVRGSLAVDVDLQCVRCLTPVIKTLTLELDERFQLPPIRASEGEQVFPIDADHHIDLGPILRELVIVDTPMRVLCGPDCEGLCPVCGKDLNQGPCDCQPDEIDLLGKTDLQHIVRDLNPFVAGSPGGGQVLVCQAMVIGVFQELATGEGQDLVLAVQVELATEKPGWQQA